jgi:hypothetical protein
VSVEALGAVLADVGEQLRDGYRILCVAQQRLAEAAGVLADLSRNHSESLVPPPLMAANDALTRCLDQLGGAMAAAERFAASL